MATYFPDTTVLINFGLINRIPLLSALVRNPTWCAIVAEECADQFQRHGLSTYGEVKAVFGTPIMPTPSENISAEMLRRQLMSPGDPREKHLGEAQTIIVATSPERDLSRPVVFITDDGAAAKAAAKERLASIDTWRLIRAARHKGSLTEQDVWNDLCTLRSNQRGWPKGVQHNRAAINEWVAPPPSVSDN